MKNLPIGIQEFSKLRENNCVYIDKTQYLYNLISKGTTYFLSRPRRFGKSLTINTFKEIFMGNKPLFEGTWIYDKWNWDVTYPVIRIDFSMISYKEKGLEPALCDCMKRLAKSFNIPLTENKPDALLNELIIGLSEKQKVVLLVDEYDKPIIDYIEDHEMAKENREILRNFYSVLKGLDAELKFIFFTGVSKFAKVSIFSELNHLNDLTFNPNYPTLTGYTFEEIKLNFDDYLTDLCKKRDTSMDELLDEIKEWYNGYSWDGINKVCNPFGFLNFLANGLFRDYWFASATPTYLLKMLKQYKFAPQELDNSIVSMTIFDKYELPNIELKSLFVETGYLTIKEKISEQEVRLGYPNREVAQAFSSHLLGSICEESPLKGEGILYELRQALIKNDMERFEFYFCNLFQTITYEQFKQEEAYFHSIFFLVVKLLGFYIESEVLTTFGRMDCVIKAGDFIYIIEFKKGASKTALNQIKEKNYHEKYLTSGKKITLIGIGFDIKKKRIAKFAKEIA